MKILSIWWEGLKQENRDGIVKILNYLGSSLPLTFLFYFSIRPNINIVILYFCVFIFILYSEHYYKWFRYGYLEEIDDNKKDSEI